MGVYDNVGDTTGQLKAEGLNVNVTFQPGVPNAGQGTLTWNIPGPVVESVDANGNVTITADPTGTTVVYGGIVFVLRTDAPCDWTNIPQDGVAYVADPTADPAMFSGDTIGNGLVVGAIYESEIKAQGGALTTSLVINDIQDQTPYYICGYIHDDQLRYYQEGNRAYSQATGSVNGRGQPARQVVLLRQIPVQSPTPVKYGVKPTDGTGLVAGATYQFELIYDPDFPKPEHLARELGKGVVRMFFSFDGGLTPTYGDLVKYLNQQIAIKCTNAVQSPVPPSAGVYYWNATTKVLYQWDGTQLNIIPNVIVQSADPAIPAINSYWWNTTNNELYQWNGLTYTLVQPQFAYPTDPTQLQSTGGGYWWNGVNGFTSCGNTWCETTTYNQTTDPSCPPTEENCSYWYDTANSTLYNWNGTNWVQSYALMWTSAPNTLPVGTYWYNLTNEELSITTTTPTPNWSNLPFISSTIDPVVQTNSVSTFGGLVSQSGIGYTVGTYSDVLLTGGTGNGATATVIVTGTVAPQVTSVVITSGGQGYSVNDILLFTGTGFAGVNSITVESVLPAGGGVVAGTLWYNPTTEILNQRDPSNTVWNVQPVLVWAGDPTIVSSCEVWWNESTSPATLYTWDVVHSTWDLVSIFYQQSTDPYANPVLTTGTLWWNPNNNTLLVWNGSSWSIIPFFNLPTDPTQPTIGTGWLNTTSNTWYIWGTPASGRWNVASPITTSATNPSTPPQGSFWFNIVGNILYQRVGNTWIPIPYVTTPPFNSKGQTWYNLSTNTLMEWNGKSWVTSTPCVYCKLEAGQLIFESVGRGSNNVVLIPIPAGVTNMPSPCLAIGTGQANYIDDIGGFVDGASPYQNYPLGGFGNSYNCYCSFETPGTGRARYRALSLNPQGYLFSHLKPVGNLIMPQVGRDGVDGTPSYDQLGVGTTGSPAERRQLMAEVRTLLGNSSVTVELDDTAMDLAVTNALRVFRQKSSLAYKRAAFFLDIEPYKQNYILADKAVGYNKIVSVMAGYRFTSAFLSSAMGAGVYGQVVLQHLYNMGTFDLLSYHLVSSYVEQLELLFSTRLVFVFDEHSRELQIFQSFNRPERILLDVNIEKNEQEIFINRYAHRWIQQYALAEACDMLANIRGKYGNLPGASGSVTLNASDLRAQAQDIRTKCQEELDDYTVQNVEDYGAYGSIAIG